MRATHRVMTALAIAVTSVACAGVASAAVPRAMQRIMDGARYRTASWSLYAADVRTGRPLYSLHAGRRSFTGSTRKLFSVGLALDALGAGARQTTTVHRRGRVDARGTLHGSLALVAGGDLAFGGRRINANTIQYTDFDHNDANALGGAQLTPQSPLYALNALARQVRRSGVRRVGGEVAVDDRLFKPYRVPNGHLLITPVMLNENMVDVSLTPGAFGRPAWLRTRPRTSAFGVRNAVTTGARGGAAAVDLSGDGRITCLGRPGCVGTVTGSLPLGYRAPLVGGDVFVHTFRVEDPDAFMRTAFIEALRRHGVAVAAAAVAPNPRRVLPRRFRYPAATRVARYRSAPFAQTARLVLKVSLNLGANLSLSLFGLRHHQRTIRGALAAERRVLIDRFGIAAGQFSFPTNGSGSPDSVASPRAIVQLLRGMARTGVAAPFRAALPILGRDGSLAHTGTTLAARGHVLAKPGTTIVPGPGQTVQLKAQTMAGYIRTRSGQDVAFALMVNNVGPIPDIENGVARVFEDEARIENAIYKGATN